MTGNLCLFRPANLLVPHKSSPGSKFPVIYLSSRTIHPARISGYPFRLPTRSSYRDNFSENFCHTSGSVYALEMTYLGLLACSLCRVCSMLAPGICLLFAPGRVGCALTGPRLSAEDPRWELEEIAVMQAQRIERLEDYIQAQQHAARERNHRNTLPPLLPRRSEISRQQSRSAVAAEEPVPMVRTVVAIPPHLRGLGNVPVFWSPFVPSHQLRAWPHSGRIVV